MEFTKELFPNMEHSVPAVKAGVVQPPDGTYFRDMFGITAADGCAEARAFGPYPGNTGLADREIRQALGGLFRHGGLPASDIMVEEVECWRGYVRADYLCVCDNHLAVIEIKSDCDTLSRFDEQVRVYSAIADRVTLVVGWNLAARALRKTPCWWQVLLAEREADTEARFVTLRDGGRNPVVEAAALVWMLPIADVRTLASQVGVYETIQPRQLRERVARKASDDALHVAVRAWLTRLSDQRRKVSS
jgi:hypothetical protein